jgi:hypothetical protein
LLLSELLADYGDIDREGAEELAKVAALTQALDRKGSVALKFSVEKKGGRVLVTVGTESKPPKPDAEVHLWHVGPDGLSKDDPYQTRIDPDTGEIHTPTHAREDHR